MGNSKTDFGSKLDRYSAQSKAPMQQGIKYCSCTVVNCGNRGLAFSRSDRKSIETIFCLTENTYNFFVDMSEEKNEKSTPIQRKEKNTSLMEEILKDIKVLQVEFYHFEGVKTNARRAV